jgi:hypothetical protein
MSQGNSRTNGISDRESNSQPNCEDHRDIGHNLSSPNSANGFCSSSLLTTAARQEEKNTASQDQAGQSSPDDWAGDEVSYQTHSVRASVEEHALATWKRHGGQ